MMSQASVEPRNPFVFIVGRGRSGTTLVRAMLTSHSDLAIPNETHFIVPLSRDRRLFHSDDQPNVEALLSKLRRQPGFRHMGLDNDEVAHLFDSERPGTYSDAIRLLFQMHARMQGKNRFGDKTPIHVLHIEYLAELFPEARFIHLIRDGRDVTLSIMDQHWGPVSVWEGAVYWRRFVQAGRLAGARVGADRYMELRYESLLDEPEQHVRALCDFVNLKFDPSMLRYFENAGEITAGEDHHRSIHLPPTKNLRNWRSEMSAADVELFEVLAGDLLTELGYERANPRVSLTARTRAAIKWGSVQRSRARRGLRKRTKRARKSFQAV